MHGIDYMNMNDSVIRILISPASTITTVHVNYYDCAFHIVVMSLYLSYCTVN